MTVNGLSDRTLLWMSIVQEVCLILFVLEYGARAICSPRPLRYIFSVWGLIDLLSVLPALLAAPHYASLKALRLMMLFRLLKLTRFVAAISELEKAVATVREELLVFLFLSMVVIYIAAVGIYHFEHTAQPEVFSSIPASMWWAVATLTTVGYGDSYPVTAGGKLFTVLILVVGLGIVAVPTGLVSTALISVKRASRAHDDTG
jgi:voltage-gated potassium channel